MNNLQVKLRLPYCLRSVLPVLIIVLSVLSCGEDDGKKKDHSFKDQDAQGKIAGNNWTYASGKFRYSDDGESIYITLYNATEDPVCATSATAFIDISFPAEPGLQEIENPGSPPVVVLLHELTVDTGAGPYMGVGKKGAVEILTITDTEVTGRMDVRESNNSFVNGNFTVSFCPEI